MNLTVKSLHASGMVFPGANQGGRPEIQEWTRDGN
jgi:hypothetical protein